MDPGGFDNLQKNQCNKIPLVEVTYHGASQQSL